MVLRAYLKDRGLACEDATLEKFDVYRGLLERGNRAMNLIGPLDRAGIEEELFCDSLSILGLGVRLEGPILDVGTGAGFPGVPLKLLMPEAPLWLVEPREKRYRFLGQVIRALGLTEVARHRSRIEALEVPRAGLVCSKAFAPVEAWLDIAAARVAAGGHVAVLCADGHWSAAREAQAAGLSLSVVATRTHRWRAGAPLRRTVLLRAAS